MGGKKKSPKKSPSKYDDEDEDDDVSMNDADDSEEDKAIDRMQMRLKNEAVVQSGCGKQRDRVRILDAFWTKVWPALEKIGWTKEDGTDDDEGLIFFEPPPPQAQGRTESHADAATGAEGEGEVKEGGLPAVELRREKFHRVKDVIDEVLERRTPEEAAVADLYEAHMEAKRAADAKAAAATTSSGKPASGSKPSPKDAVLPISRTARNNNKNNSSNERTPPRKDPSPATTTTKSPNMLDDSWKEGGRNFPKRSSSIGNRYQVSKIPEAGTYEEGASEKYCTLMWDPKRAEEKGPECFEAIELLPFNVREAALGKLAELDYDVESFRASAVRALKPVDGSNWGPDRRARYRDEIFRARKDLRAVCRAMRISMRTCLAYYLGTFKSTDDYRLLKTVCAEEYKMRLEANEYEFDACAICGDGGSLLICDGCEGEYHMECCRPALRSVPEGYWLCDECVDRRFLAARQYLIQKSRLFEKCPDRKRRLDEVGGGMEDDPSGGSSEQVASTSAVGLEKVVFRPTDPVLAAVRTFAKELNQVLSTGRVVAPVSEPKPEPSDAGIAPVSAKEPEPMQLA